jgi:hypothetical protein
MIGPWATPLDRVMPDAPEEGSIPGNEPGGTMSANTQLRIGAGGELEALERARLILEEWQAGHPHTKSYWTVRLGDALELVLRALEHGPATRGW